MSQHTAIINFSVIAVTSEDPKTISLNERVNNVCSEQFAKACRLIPAVPMYPQGFYPLHADFHYR